MKKNIMVKGVFSVLVLVGMSAYANAGSGATYSHTTFQAPNKVVFHNPGFTTGVTSSGNTVSNPLVFAGDNYLQDFYCESAIGHHTSYTLSYRSKPLTEGEYAQYASAVWSNGNVLVSSEVVYYPIPVLTQITCSTPQF